MTAIQNPDSSNNNKRKRKSTTVDLTPMVDLGFILITFFMFTTSMNMPRTLPYITPDQLEGTLPMTIKKSTVITCLLCADHSVYTFRGLGTAEVPTDFRVLSLDHEKDNSLRDELVDFMSDVQALKSGGLLDGVDHPIVIIKPDTSSTFDDLVTVMDEILITGIPSQVTVPITSQDRSYIQTATQRTHF